MEKHEKRNKQESPGRGGGVCSLGEESRKQRRSEEMAARKWERRTNGRSKNAGRITHGKRNWEKTEVRKSELKRGAKGGAAKSHALFHVTCLQKTASQQALLPALEMVCGNGGPPQRGILQEEKHLPKQQLWGRDLHESSAESPDLTATASKTKSKVSIKCSSTALLSLLRGSGLFQTRVF
eukprot:XP_015141909.1 uncharacterized protein LOC107053371 [Gallus gallus]